MKRRNMPVKGNLSLLFLFYLLAVALNFNINLTALLGFSFYAAQIMVIIYIGYKFGRTPGLVFGFLTGAFWFVASLFLEKHEDILQFLFKGGRIKTLSAGGFAMYSHSFQHALIIAGLGFFSGVLFDMLERFLKNNDLSLEECIPRKQVNYLQGMYNFLLLFFRAHSKEENSPQGSFAARWSGRVVNLQIAIILVPFCYGIMYILPVDIGTASSVQFNFPPAYLVSLVLLVYAYSKGSRAGITMVLTVWFLTILSCLFLVTGEFDIGFSHELRPDFFLASPVQAAGLSILAWWLGKVGKIMRNDSVRDKLATALKTYSRQTPSATGASYLIVFVLLVFSLRASFQTEHFIFNYSPLFPMIFIAVAWGARQGMVPISNRTLIMLIPITLVSFQLCFGQFGLYTLLLSAPLALLIAAIPHIAGRLDTSRIESTRMIFYGSLIAIVVHQIYIVNSAYPGVLFFTIGKVYDAKEAYMSLSYFSDILLWAFTMFAIETASRLLVKIQKTKQFPTQ